MTRSLLNVSNIESRSRVNGPGTRAVVWVQGCTIGCPGCFNPHTHAHETRRLLDPRSLGLKLLADDGIDGLTLSGGEPFEQARACSILAHTVRDSGKSVMVFSGYRYDILEASPDESVHDFLNNVDLLVAGPYVESMQADGSDWRASTNQHVHFLTDRLRYVAETKPDLRPVVELRVTGAGIAMTGFPHQRDIEWVKKLATDSPRFHGQTHEDRNDGRARLPPRTGKSGFTSLPSSCPRR